MAHNNNNKTELVILSDFHPVGHNWQIQSMRESEFLHNYLPHQLNIKKSEN